MRPYQQTSIKELAAEGRYSLVGGPFGSKLGRKDYRRTGVPVIRGANLPLDQRFSADDFVFVSEQKADDLRANLAFPGDVVVTQRGTLGQVGLIPYSAPFPRFVISQSQMKVTVDPSKANNQFVYYALRSPEVQHRILSSALTSGVPHINLGLFEDLRIPSPELGIQRTIAGALAAYDELIENNLRRIEILEAMAQAIYKEWFVNFRFPGHEQVSRVSTEIGLIPESWKAGTLNDLLVLQRGFDLPVKKRQAGHVPVIAATGEHGTHNQMAVKGPGVVTGRSGSLGTVLYISEDFWPLNTTLWVKDFRVATPQLAYFTLKALDLKQFNSGAAVPTLNRNDISSHPMPVPPDELIASFSTHVSDMFQLINILRKEVDRLQEARDLLLPKLISGEIDVSDLDIDTSWLAA